MRGRVLRICSLSILLTLNILVVLVLIVRRRLVVVALVVVLLVVVVVLSVIVILIVVLVVITLAILVIVVVVLALAAVVVIVLLIVLVRGVILIIVVRVWIVWTNTFVVPVILVLVIVVVVALIVISIVIALAVILIITILLIICRATAIVEIHVAHLVRHLRYLRRGAVGAGLRLRGVLRLLRLFVLLLLRHLLLEALGYLVFHEFFFLWANKKIMKLICNFQCQNQKMWSKKPITLKLTFSMSHWRNLAYSDFCSCSFVNAKSSSGKA